MSTNRIEPRASIAEHHLEWNDRLQDWLDGAASTDAALFETHLTDCPICQERLADLQELDSDLSEQAPRPQLDAKFDAQLLARIDSMDEAQRAAARQRVEQELQRNLRALSHSWRRTLAFVIPSMAAGIAVAFGLVGYFDAAGFTGKLAAEGASSLGGDTSQISVVLTVVLGAAIGAVTARWLARITD